MSQLSQQSRRSTPSQTLCDAWDNAKEALTQFATILRTSAGCENVNISVCLRNRNYVDTYSLPGFSESEIHGMETADVEPCHDLKMCLPPGNEQECLASKEETRMTNISDEMYEDLRRLSIKQLRCFFTNVRLNLKLPSFDWPDAAKNRFLAEMDGPLPSAPGRANSGKDALLIMLRWSVDLDEGWRMSVREAHEAFKKQRSRHSKGDHDHDTVEDEAQDDGLRSSEQVCEVTDSALRCGTASGSDGMENDSIDSGSGYAENPESVDVHEVVKSLPSDVLKVTEPRNRWVPLPTLLSVVRHPRVNPGCEWFIQPTPADGNCMFSSVLIAASLRGCLPSSLSSIQSMRSFLRRQLMDLSRAGEHGSRYRRDWLASCSYDVDSSIIGSYCSSRLERALTSFSDTDMESFLKPLRVFVSNWADMVGHDHWGGLLRIELFILADIFGSVIEVMQLMSPSSNWTSSEKVIEACDARHGNRNVWLRRSDLIYPLSATLPSPDQRYVGPEAVGNTDSGWVGPFPVLRILLNDRHYNACTQKCSYPISPLRTGEIMSVRNAWFTYSGTLVEPFCALSNEEKVYHERALQMIGLWRESVSVSEERGRHADTIIMQTKCTNLTVSMLSHLEVPYSSHSGQSSFQLSDEVITCYMHLLQKRSQMLTQQALAKGAKQPPLCLYLDSWFFKSISRGLSGPSSQRKKLDLLPFTIIILPALVTGHWVLAVCYVHEGIIGIFDPLGTPREDVFNVVRNWVQAQLPSGGDKEWTFKNVTETRGCAQIGTVDCGIYICKAAESLGLGMPVRISQVDIQYVRKRMMVEFVRQELCNIRWPRS